MQTRYSLVTHLPLEVGKRQACDSWRLLTGSAHGDWVPGPPRCCGIALKQALELLLQTHGCQRSKTLS